MPSSAAAGRAGLGFAARLGVAALLIWLVLPIVPLLVWSFAKGWYFPQVVPSTWSLDAWAYVFSPLSGVVDSLAATFAVAIGATALSVLVGVPAGRALGLYRFRGKAAVELLVLAPTIVPGIAVALGMHVVFIRYGLANTLGGVMLVHLVPTLPYMTLIMASVFSAYNTDLEDQARSLGASAWQICRHVMLPAVLPGIVVGALFAFLISWSQYILTLLIGGGQVITLPLLLFNFATAGRSDVAGAISVLYLLPGVLILLATSKHLTGGGAFGQLQRA